MTRGYGRYSVVAAILLIPAIAGVQLCSAAQGIDPGWEPQNPAIAALGAPSKPQDTAPQTNVVQVPQKNLGAPTASAGPSFITAPPRRVEPFPILLNHIVQRYVDEYLNQPGTLEGSFKRSRPYLPQMVRVMRSYGVPEDLVYLAFAESEFSRRGKGPWQFTKGTAKRYGLRVNHWVDERRDPILSTRAAAEYLADLHDAAGYDWRVAVVGWNRGDLAINRYWVMRGGSFNRYMARLPHDTQCLLARFMAVAFIAHNAAAYGIGNVNYDAAPSYSALSVRGGTKLTALAHKYGIQLRQLKELNPAILRDRVPPYAHTYSLRIPILRTAKAY